MPALTLTDETSCFSVVFESPRDETIQSWRKGRNGAINKTYLPSSKRIVFHGHSGVTVDGSIDKRRKSINTKVLKKSHGTRSLAQRELEVC